MAIIDHGGIAVEGTSEQLKSGISSDRIMIVEADGITEDVLSALRAAYPHVEDVEGSIQIHGEAIDLYELQDLLRPRGVTIRSTHLKTVSLDDVFLH